MALAREIEVGGVKGFLLTPRTGRGNKRLHLYVNAKDHAKILRGRRWHATVTDLLTGSVYEVRGASCGSMSCFCDAIAKRVP